MDSHTCRQCSTSFASRTLLFRHIREERHFAGGVQPAPRKRACESSPPPTSRKARCSEPRTSTQGTQYDLAGEFSPFPSVHHRANRSPDVPPGANQTPAAQFQFPTRWSPQHGGHLGNELWWSFPGLPSPHSPLDDHPNPVVVLGADYGGRPLVARFQFPTRWSPHSGGHLGNELWRPFPPFGVPSCQPNPWLPNSSPH